MRTKKHGVWKDSLSLSAAGNAGWLRCADVECLRRYRGKEKNSKSEKKLWCRTWPLQTMHAVGYVSDSKSDRREYCVLSKNGKISATALLEHGSWRSTVLVATSHEMLDLVPPKKDTVAFHGESRNPGAYFCTQVESTNQQVPVL